MDLQQQLEQLDQSIEELKAEKSRVMQAMNLEKQDAEAKRLEELHEYIGRIVSVHNGLDYDFKDEKFYYDNGDDQFDYAFSLDGKIKDLKKAEKKLDNLIYIYSVALSQFDYTDRYYEEDRVKVDLSDFSLIAEFNFHSDLILEIEIECRKEDYLVELNLDETTRLNIISSDDADISISDRRMIYTDTDDVVEIMKDMIENVCNYRERLA